MATQGLSTPTEESKAPSRNEDAVVYMTDREPITAKMICDTVCDTCETLSALKDIIEKRISSNN